MTPDQLAKSGSEHGEQRALFAWLVVAQRVGFKLAWQWAESGNIPPYDPTQGDAEPALAWIFAVPNGGLRDKITAAKLKHEGVKKGVPDVFVPVPCRDYAGLFIEMKRSEDKENNRRKGVTSDAQETWITYLRSVRYACSVCFDWRSAARDIQSYIEQARTI